jgi:hypothetical protein
MRFECDCCVSCEHCCEQFSENEEHEWMTLYFQNKSLEYHFCGFSCLKPWMDLNHKLLNEKIEEGF